MTDLPTTECESSESYMSRECELSSVFDNDPIANSYLLDAKLEVMRDCKNISPYTVALMNMIRDIHKYKYDGESLNIKAEQLIIDELRLCKLEEDLNKMIAQMVGLINKVGLANDDICAEQLKISMNAKEMASKNQMGSVTDHVDIKLIDYLENHRVSFITSDYRNRNLTIIMRCIALYLNNCGVQNPLKQNYLADGLEDSRFNSDDIIKLCKSGELYSNEHVAKCMEFDTDYRGIIVLIFKSAVSHAGFAIKDPSDSISNIVSRSLVEMICVVTEQDDKTTIRVTMNSWKYILDMLLKLSGL